jgi:hypothetical protein
VPFLRFSRDKRGYEHFYLVEPTTRRGKTRHRILYWFRTPPGVKVGRLPFDEPMKRALESRYPNLSFDWQKLIDTPVPPPAPDVERWRERRRLERAAKQAAASEAAAENEGSASEDQEIRAAEASSPAYAEPDAAAGVSVGLQPGRRRRRRSGRRGRTTSTPNVAADASGQDEGAVDPTKPTDVAERSGNNRDRPERDGE